VRENDQSDDMLDAGTLSTEQASSDFGKLSPHKMMQIKWSV